MQKNLIWIILDPFCLFLAQNFSNFNDINTWYLFDFWVSLLVAWHYVRNTKISFDPCFELSNGAWSEFCFAYIVACSRMKGNTVWFLKTRWRFQFFAICIKYPTFRRRNPQKTWYRHGNGPTKFLTSKKELKHQFFIQAFVLGGRGQFCPTPTGRGLINSNCGLGTLYKKC